MEGHTTNARENDNHLRDYLVQRSNGIAWKIVSEAISKSFTSVVVCPSVYILPSIALGKFKVDKTQCTVERDQLLNLLKQIYSADGCVMECRFFATDAQYAFDDGMISSFTKYDFNKRGMEIADTRKTEIAKLQSQNVNDWVISTTNGFLNPNGMQRFGSMNTIFSLVYLKMFWQIPFKEKYTKPELFTDIDGREHEISMMISEKVRPRLDSLLCHDNGSDMDFEALRVTLLLKNKSRAVFAYPVDPNFSGDTLSKMLLVIADNLINDKWKSYKKHYNTVELHLPKIKIETMMTSSHIRKVLRELVGGQSLETITKICIDEQGVEAAAFGTLCIDSPSRVLKVEFNRPFIFAILNEGGAILFCGTFNGAS